MEEKLSPVDKVYFAFYQSKKKSMYFNEIRDKTKMSISSLQNALLKMEKLKQVNKVKEKGNTFYSLVVGEVKSLIFTKLDLQKLNSLNINVKVPLNEFVAVLDKVAFVFYLVLLRESKKKREVI